MKNSEYRLRVHDRVLGMRFHPSRYASLCRDYFNTESVPQNPDILLDVKIGGFKTEVEVEDSLFISKVLKKKGFEMSGGLVKGRYDRDTRHGKIRAHKVLMTNPTIRVFEQLLYQAFYSANPAEYRNEFLIHSCGVMHGGRGYLFVGPPESGKSTVARLSLPDRVLNDEINLIRFSTKEVEICNTPFNGLFKEKSEGRGTLRAVLLLRQASEHKLINVDGAEAVKALVREIVPPIGLDSVITPEVRADMLDMAIRIQQSVPVYRMEFQHNAGFWELIDREI
jgi:hypothetical protein